MSIPARLAARVVFLLALVGSLLVVAGPADAAWKGTLTWRGAVTQACRVPVEGNRVRVNVRLNNTNGSEDSSGGLNRVVGGQAGNSWTYTRNTHAGEVSNVASLVFAQGVKVYLLIGSRVGITDEKIIKISTLPRC